MKKVTPERRRELTRAFLSSDFYRLVFEPHIKKRISDCDKISEIDQTNVEKSFYLQKNKADIFKGILTRFQEWANKNYKNEEVKRYGSTTRNTSRRSNRRT